VVLERGNREDWFESSTIRALSLAAAAGLVLFVWWELRSRAPAVNLRVLRDRGLVAGTVYSVVVGCGIYSSLFFLPVFLQQVRGYTATQTGMMLVVDGIAAAVSMASAGRLVARAPARLLVGIGTLMFAASMYLLYGITADTGPEQIRLALILRGGSLGFTFVPLSIAALTGLKGQDMADGSGLFNLTRQWGGSAGIAFLSTLLEHRSAFHRAILVEHVNLYSPMVAARYRMVQSYLVQRGVPPAVAPQKTAALMERIVEQQAAVMGFADVFLALAAVFMMALPLLFLFSKAGAEPVAAPLV
jgi:DHA2 family multidrug resistance protein